MYSVVSFSFFLSFDYEEFSQPQILLEMEKNEWLLFQTVPSVDNAMKILKKHIDNLELHTNLEKKPFVRRFYPSLNSIRKNNQNGRVFYFSLRNITK